MHNKNASQQVRFELVRSIFYSMWSICGRMTLSNLKFLAGQGILS